MTNEIKWHPFPEERPPKEGQYLITNTAGQVFPDVYMKITHLPSSTPTWLTETGSPVLAWAEFPKPYEKPAELPPEFRAPYTAHKASCARVSPANGTIMLRLEFSDGHTAADAYISAEAAYQLIADMLETLNKDLPPRSVVVSSTSLTEHIGLMARRISYAHKEHK